jgi:hypothetical protein
MARRKGISSMEARLAEVTPEEVERYSTGAGLKEAMTTFSQISRDTIGMTKAGREVRGGQNPRLLGSSTKIEHNDESGVDRVLGSRQWVSYQQPAAAAGIPGCNTCGSNTKGCTNACLAKSGQLGLASGEVAKQARTAFAWNEPAKFLGALHAEIGRREKTAINEGRIPVMRLNGTSDIGWHRLPSGMLIIGSRPNTQFNEYTKFNTGDVVDEEDPNPYENYHWIHSVTEHTTVPRIEQITSTGRNVAVPFNMKKGDPVPDTMRLGDRQGRSIELPVVKEGGQNAGDLHDMRHLDQKIGGIVALRVKPIVQNGTRGVFDETGFIRPVDAVETPVTIGRRGHFDMGHGR